MFQLEKRHQKIIKQILSKYSYQFYAYGSRVKGTARKFSDLDLCYKENIPDAIVFRIEEEFKESDLPFIVELVAWEDMKVGFREMIEEDLTLIS